MRFLLRYRPPCASPATSPKITPGETPGSLTPGDLVGKLEVLRFACDKCDRRGQYPVATLVRELGANAMLTYLSTWLTRDCQRVIAARYTDWCGIHCPDLPKVFPVPPEAPRKKFEGRR